jgi:predicted Na+-dependent transporter
MPLWFYTIGRTLSKRAEISIPLMRLILNLLLTICPCLLGILLSRKFPNLRRFFMKYAKKIVLVLVVSFLVIIFIAKYYVLRLVTWQQWITGPLIPWSGFALGGFFAWLFKRPGKQIYTISIETGLQNVSIAYMIVMLNFPSPESDYALLPLVAISSITTVPLWFVLFAKTVYAKLKAARTDQKGKELEQNVLYSNKEPVGLLLAKGEQPPESEETERLTQPPKVVAVDNQASTQQSGVETSWL